MCVNFPWILRHDQWPGWHWLCILSSHCGSNNTKLGGGNSNIFFLTPTWGNDPIWRAYFSKGLKPPTRQPLEQSLESFYNHWNLPSLKLTAKAPKKGWLEYYFPIGEAYFQGRAVSFREGKRNTRFFLKTTLTIIGTSYGVGRGVFCRVLAGISKPPGTWQQKTWQFCDCALFKDG